MIYDFLTMNGYGLFVWSAFIFSHLCLVVLYVVTKVQFIKERNKFISKFGALDSRRAEIAKLQTINKKILSTSRNI